MNDVLRMTAPENVRKTAAELHGLGVTIPKAVREHLDRLDALDAARPAEVTQADLEAVYIDGRGEDEARRVAADIATHPARRNAWSEARIKVARRAVAELTAHGNDLTRELAKLAAPLIEKLTDAAALDTLDTTSLIRAGRSADAEAAARVEIVAGDLEHLYRLRDRLTKGAEYGVDRFDCRRWKDPRRFAYKPGQSTADAFLSGIKADAGLWFPLPHEAEAQAAPIAKEARAEAQAERQRSRGGVVAFG